MVLTLQELCLFKVRDSVENGQCPPAHKLPPPLRQWIFETILKHGTLNNRECIDMLGSTEFLNGFKWINTNTKGEEIDDSAFLEKAAESIGQINSGTSIGEGIVRLDLRIHVNETNSAVRLISTCLNLKSLHLDMDHGEHECFDAQFCTDGWHVLNQSAESDPCRSVLENVSELSIVGRNAISPRYVALRNDSPCLEFRALTSLQLKSCLVDVAGWRKLLETTRNTLQNLRVIDVEAIDDEGNPVDDWILPFSMPRLTNFEYRGTVYAELIIPARLIECGALEHVHVQVVLGADFTDVELEKLSAIQQSIKSVDISAVLGAEDLVDQTTAIVEKLFRQVGPNVKSLQMSYADVDICATAIEQCPNLEQLEWDVETDIEASRCLINLFRNRERAEKLRKLQLWGHYDLIVLDALFENCRNLQKLSIQHCSELIDKHLIDLAGRCSPLKKLEIESCENIGDDGLVAILIASGSPLQRLAASGSAKITAKTWMTMIDRCPNVVEISNISQQLEEARREKSFNRFVQMLPD